MHAATDPVPTFTASSITGSSAPPTPDPDAYLCHTTRDELQHLLVSAHDAGYDTAPYLRELSRRHWGSGADTSAAASLRARPAATRKAA